MMTNAFYSSIFLLILFIINLKSICSTATTTMSPDIINEAECFQLRYLNKNSQYENEYRKKCGQIFVDNFCEHVQCLSIESCPNGYELIENIVGHKCCPACVKLLDENDECEPESMSMDDRIERCKNGMICDHMIKRCRLPDLEQMLSSTKPCLREYHNRWSVRQNKMFYIMSANNAIKSLFPIPYAHEQFLPHCTFDGTYAPKQPSRNK